MYAANAPAELSVSAGEGCTVWYTTDGSEPEVNKGTAKKADGDTISVTPAANIDQTVTVKAIAEQNGLVSTVAEKTIRFIAIPESETGTQVYEGSASCPGMVGAPYDVKVRVTVVNGIIQKIEDNGTEPEDIRDEAYWDTVYRGDLSGKDISEKLSGKNLSELLAAKTTPNNTSYNTDAVSGATISSDAVKYATVAALRTEPISTSEETVLAPTVTPSYGYTVTSTSSSAHIPLSVSAAAGTTVYYTTDGTKPTQDSQQVSASWSGSSVDIDYDSETYPEGQKIPVKFAAFDAQGTSSRVVTVWVVFAQPQMVMPYETGTYTATVEDVTASVEIVNDYGDAPIVQSITLDAASEKTWENVLPELFADIYLAQTVDTVSAEGYGSDVQKVLNAVNAALEQAERPPVPECTVSPAVEKYSGSYGPYAFDAPPEITLSSTVEEAQIYYVQSDSSYSYPEPDTTEWTLYTEAFQPTFTKTNGGSSYIHFAATTDGGQTWSETDHISIEYEKRMAEDAFLVGDETYSSFNEAARAVQEGGTIVINTDELNLLADTVMPEFSCTITSPEGQCYNVSADQPITLNANLTLENIDWQVETYLNGYNFTAGSGCYENDWRFSGTSIYAGCMTGEVDRSPKITLQSGMFNIYASGAEDTTLTGNVAVNVAGTADVWISGAAQGATLEGDFETTVTGDACFLRQFYGRMSGGEVTGALQLTIVGNPQLMAYGTVYACEQYWYSDKPQWGTLDLTQAGSAFEGSRFEGFETTLTNTESQNAE